MNNINIITNINSEDDKNIIILINDELKNTNNE